jgi:protein O-GlcNAc transferase
MTIPQAFQTALQHHQAGRLTDAEALYRQILAVQPDHAEALHSLGLLAHQVGRHDLALEWIRQAIVLDPHNPVAHSNLGEAFRALGRLDEAMAAYRRALEIKPDYANARYNLGVALRNRGQLAEAIAAFLRALELKPDFPEAHNNLGVALAGQGHHREAISAYRRALQLRPSYPEARNNLGVALAAQDRHDEAIAAYRQALTVKPTYPEAHYNLGIALREQGRLDEAVSAYLRALELKPDYPEAHYNLGNALRERGHLDEAISAYGRALEIKPGFPEALLNLDNVLRKRGRLDEAVAACRRALELKPDYPEACNGLGNALKDLGQVGEAITAYRHALILKPDHAPTHSNLIYTLHFHPDQDARTISEEHQRWNRQFSDPLKPFILPHTNDPDAERRLRVGYVSPDFWDHPVGRYMLPLLERHDRERFDVLFYSGVTRPDWMTQRLRALAGTWRSTAGVSDARLAETIREDKVDILVDLSLHTAGNRLPVFARQPAPVQVSWLGYPGGAGLPGIGHRLTDACMDPPGGQPASSGEEPVRLPGCWCCYDPVGDSPEINALPALSSEHLTFGSLNNFAKVHEGVLALWARVLDALERSRILILCPEGSARERVRSFFAARGIGAERIEWAGVLPRPGYLQLYQQIDIALDPFPFNGMTTTCDALWMGVPVLTIPGKTPAARAGLSLLSSIGLEELSASSEEDYVRLAVDLARNLPRLAALRATLRPRMQSSPLMDAPCFARNIEAAYRSMWQSWCAQNPPFNLRDPTSAPDPIVD